MANGELGHDDFKFLSAEIGEEAKTLAAELGFSNGEIFGLKNDTVSHKDFVYEMLKKWHQKNGSTVATPSNLADKLRKAELTAVAEKFEKFRQQTLNPPDTLPVQPPAPTDGRNEIFISFKWSAKEEANRFKDRIEQHFGIGSCWICTNELLGGDNLPEEIVNALNGAKVVLCMIKKDYPDSEACRKEVSIASEKKKSVIPVLLERVTWPLVDSSGKPSPLQWNFTGKMYVNYFDTSVRKKEFTNLIESIERTLGKR